MVKLIQKWRNSFENLILRMIVVQPVTYKQLIH